MSNSLNLDLNDDEETPPSAIVSNTANAENVEYVRPDYIPPLQQVKEITHAASMAKSSYGQRDPVTRAAVKNYQQLMTPVIAVEAKELAHEENPSVLVSSGKLENNFFLSIKQDGYGVFKHKNHLHLLSLFELAYQVNQSKIAKSWQQDRLNSTTNLVSQPLLLPVVLTLSKEQMSAVQNYQALLELAGVVCVIQDKAKGKQLLQIRQFPAILRDRDVSSSFITIIDTLLSTFDSDNSNQSIDFDNEIICAIANVMIASEFSIEQAQALWLSAKKELSDELIETVLLNSVPLDLTSEIKQLKAKLATKKN
jgi:DNA mismatch repair protein MutL